MAFRFFESRKLKNAYKRGKAAHKAGLGLHQNPYKGRFAPKRRRNPDSWTRMFIDAFDHHPYSQAGQWQLGWLDAEKE